MNHYLDRLDVIAEMRWKALPEWVKVASHSDPIVRYMARTYQADHLHSLADMMSALAEVQTKRCAGLLEELQKRALSEPLRLIVDPRLPFPFQT